MRDTLTRAIDKIEKLNTALDKADELIEHQDRLIKSLEVRDQYRSKEIAALRDALTTEESLRRKEAERADLAEKRVTQLEKRVNKTSKLQKFAIISTIVFAGLRTFVFN